MANPDFQWEVTRSGGAVRIDLTKASNVAEADTEAIAAATEALLTDEEVTVVQLEGPVLEGGDQPPDGLGAAIESLDALADRYGKRLIVSPI
jgi:hypothetical protein